jgi:hypothetical protein
MKNSRHARLTKLALSLTFSLIGLLYAQFATSQMRQIYLDSEADNELLKSSFYSPSEGYVAFRDWIGYTADTGRTFTKKYITLANVDFGSYSVNVTFGFIIFGVKAFNQNTIIAYGHYGLVPAILRSTNGGNNFTLVFHGLYNPAQFNGEITDMNFPVDNLVGFAVDGDRVLKTVNGGVTWSVVRIEPNRLFTNVQAVDNSYAFAYSTGSSTKELIKTINGGSNWTALTLPPGDLTYAYFLNAGTGWISMHNGNNEAIYKTSNGGNSWILQNNLEATPFWTYKMRFLDDNTGYAFSTTSQNVVCKTSDGGKVWEPLPRDNSYSYLGYIHNDLHFWNSNQFWAGGGHGFLELTTNGGGTPLPRAYFRIDTAGLSATGNVNLLNYSRTGYTYKWYKNDTLISTSYNASYSHYLFSSRDSVKLVVSNGTNVDSVTKYQSFNLPVIVSSFTPQIAGTGNIVTITGMNFTGANSVRFGGVAASGYTVVSSTKITATVGAGASGDVKVTTPTGSGSLPGFIFLPPPTLTSLTPATATAGATVTITGTNLINVSVVKFGGINAVSFTEVSPTTITAVIPSGPSGAVSVTTQGGTATLNGYVALPTVTSFTPTQGTYGTTITITGTSLSGTTAVSLGGTPVASFTVVSNSNITATIGAGASGDVMVTKLGGSSSLAGFVWISPPVVSSFSPLSGSVGSTVNIVGSGFNPVPANNIVYFGAVRALVTSASTTSLTVTVPIGATYEPISVSSNGLIAYSSRPFTVGFANGGGISSNSFATTSTINTDPANGPTNISLGDLDGDGRTDLIIPYYSSTSSGVYVYRNTSTSSTISFANPLNLTGLNDKGVGTGDFDGDGKLDMAVLNFNSISIFKNTSTSGNIAFTPGPILAAGTSLQAISIGDVDGDGRTDIVVNHYPETAVSVYRNTTQDGSMSFANRVNLVANGGKSILLVNLDDDNKPEIVVPDAVTNHFSVLKNNCSPASISFGTQIIFPGYIQSYMTAGDMDGDGKIDLVSGNRNQLKVDVIRNISTGANIAFAPNVEYNIASTPTGIAVGDLDGDSKPDIATVLASHDLAIFKNTSTPGTLSFLSAVNYLPGSFTGLHMLAIGDINGDGKNDPVVVAEGQRTVYTHINTVIDEPFVQSFSPTIGSTGTSVTITGGNFTGITAVSFGGIPATSFVVNSSTSITAIVGAGATGDVTVTNSLGTTVLPGFVFGIPPAIISMSPASGQVNTTVTISGNNFSSVAADNTVYFGGVRSNILSATNTTLTVSSPYGSTYDRVQVTTRGLSAYTNQPFITTFSGATGNFTINSFGQQVVRYGSGITGYLSDIDIDGKLDIVSITGTSVGVARNTSLPNSITFASEITSPSLYSPVRFAGGDIDGDGKPDVALVCGTNTLSVLRNTSIPGTISFSPRLDYITGAGSPTPSDVAINDIDGDGKPELVAANSSTSMLTIFKNNSTPSNISLDQRIDFYVDYSPTRILFADLDNDGRAEMICAHNSSQAFSIFRNTSVPGTISFAPKMSIGTFQGRITAADVDYDGKTDIIFLGGNALTIYRNISTNGNIAFAPQVNYSANSGSAFINTNDIDGDGKTDIFFANNASFDLFKNNCTPGNISFSPAGFDVYANAGQCTSGDVDIDGRPDIVTFHPGGAISFFRNQVGGEGPRIISYSPVSAPAGATITLDGTNFTGTTSVTFGGVPVSSFTIVSRDTITAVLGSGASGDILVTAQSGKAGKSGFIFGSSPRIASFAPNVVNDPGTIVSIHGANFIGISGVSFGGVAASNFTVVSSTLITAIVGTGATGDVVVTTATESATLAGFSFVPSPVITSFTPTTGVFHSIITINGNNFTGATAVSFGDVAADFTVVSPTLITATVQNGASGDVKVTTPAGSGSLSGFAFGARPLVQSFTPTSAQTGATVLIKGSNFIGTTGIQFGGVPASSFTVVSPTAILAIVGSGNSGYLTASNAFGNALTPGFTHIPGNAPVITNISPSTASIGSTVTITGLNFTGVTAVNFGGTPASSFTIVSQTTITAVVGNGSSGNLTITNSAGTGTSPGFILTSAPIISSFDPLMAAPGTQVTIQGFNFNTNATANTVYFGNVKAVVSSASATSITAVVPNGAMLAPLSVTTNNLTGYSIKSFFPTFIGGGNLNMNAFSVRVDSGSVSEPLGLSLTDIDIDGKPDISIANLAGGTGSYNVTIYRNVGTPGTIAMAPRMVQTAFVPHKTWYADFNGDGKQDLVTSGTSDVNALIIFPNNSSPGSISFGSPVTLIGNIAPFRSTSADFDGDGKPDIACVGYTGMVIYRNTSSGNTISFAPRTAVATSGLLSAAVPADIDGDGKTDLVISGQSALQVLRNTSSVGAISFSALSISLPNTGPYRDIATYDFDGDNKLDIAITNEAADQVIIFKNASIPSQILFDNGISLPAGDGPQSISLADMDGNEKADIVVANRYSGTVNILPNKSTSGMILFDPKFQVLLSNPSVYVSTADMDGDGKPDIVTAHPLSNSISILRNRQPTAAIDNIPVCLGGNTTVTSQITGTTYQWQKNTGTGFLDLSDNSNYSGTNTATLQMQNIQGSWNNQLYRCIVNGSQVGYLFKLIVGPSVVPSVTISTSSTSICTGSNVLFEATTINGGTSPVYQWQVNGVNVGNNANTYSATNIANGAQVNVTFTSNATCASPATVISNSITMTVSSQLTPEVVINTPSTTVCPGANVAFVATPTNGGSSPSYQWQVNGVNVGINSNTFTTSSLNNNDEVKVTLTSNASCATTSAATSNSINMTVGAVVVSSVSITASSSSICPGSMITFTASPLNGGSSPSYQWQVDGVNVGSNSNTFSSSSLSNGAQVKAIMNSSVSCALPATVTSNVINVIVNPNVTPSVVVNASSQNICSGASVVFTATPTNGGSTPAYQWKKNGINVGGNSNTYNINSLTNGDIVSVVMTSNAACVSSATANSNNITITVNTGVVPGIAIFGQTNLTQGQATLITGGVVNQGSSPTYVWQDSTQTHTWQAILGATASSLNYTPAVTGTKIRCILTSNASCANPLSVTSNALSLTVNTVTAIDPVPASRYGIRLYPNPVSSSFIIDSLRLSDRWQSLHISSINGKHRILSRSIANQTKVNIDVTILPAGLYLVIMNKKSGEEVFLKFIKL